MGKDLGSVGSVTLSLHQSQWLRGGVFSDWFGVGHVYGLGVGCFLIGLARVIITLLQEWVELLQGNEGLGKRY